MDSTIEEITKRTNTTVVAIQNGPMFKVVKKNVNKEMC